jgi:hypothetical protein
LSSSRGKTMWRFVRFRIPGLPYEACASVEV